MKHVTALPHVTVTLYPQGCYSTFTDGTTWAAQPHHTPDYDTIAERCGYLERAMDGTPDMQARARMEYCREHDFFHHLVGQHFYGGVSLVLWHLAHGETPDPKAAAFEEAMTMTVQRWVRAHERPIIGGVDWDGLKRTALALLDG